MKRFVMVMLCAVVGVSAARALAQPGPTDSAEELRRQIRALEGKLRNAEERQDENARVTELGGTARSRGRDPEMVLRLYDLSDLFTVAPAYPATVSQDLGAPAPLFPMPANAGRSGVTGMGGMGGGFFRVEDKPQSVVVPPTPALGQHSAGTVDSTRSSLDDLMKAITSTINPTSWDDVGGPGSIASLGSSLLISNDLRTHDQIDALLEQLRKRWGTLRTVSVRAEWLWLTATQLDQLLLDAQKPAKGDDVRAFGLVDETAWKKLQEQWVKNALERTGYQAAVTCYNGQTVSTLAGRQELVISSVSVEAPKAQPAGQGGAEAPPPMIHPAVSVVQQGAALQVTPTTNVSGKFVILDIHSRVALLRPAAEKKPAAAVSPVIAAIDRPTLSIHRLSTTLRVPIDRRMLIGGMTYEADPRGGEPNLYLFATVGVQELRDDVPKAKGEPFAKPVAVEKK